MAEINRETNVNENIEQTIDIQAAIEKARKEERDKLYADIEKLKADVASKAKVCNENYVTISDLQKELKVKEKEIADIDVKIEKAKEDGKLESNKELETLKVELEDYKAKLAKAEKDFADYKTAEEVKAYRAEKLKDIEDEFKTLVKGVTKEEIDSSYEQVKALQDTVKEKYTKKDNPLPTPKQQQQKAPKKTSDLLDKLKNMSLDEYKKARQANFR